MLNETFTVLRLLCTYNFDYLAGESCSFQIYNVDIIVKFAREKGEFCKYVDADIQCLYETN